jgi:hypothetical protein
LYLHDLIFLNSDGSWYHLHNEPYFESLKYVEFSSLHLNAIQNDKIVFLWLVFICISLLSDMNHVSIFLEKTVSDSKTYCLHQLIYFQWLLIISLLKISCHYHTNFYFRLFQFFIFNEFSSHVCWKSLSSLPFVYLIDLFISENQMIWSFWIALRYNDENSTYFCDSNYRSLWR